MPIENVSITQKEKVSCGVRRCSARKMENLPDRLICLSAWAVNFYKNILQCYPDKDIQMFRNCFLLTCHNWTISHRNFFSNKGIQWMVMEHFSGKMWTKRISIWQMFQYGKLPNMADWESSPLKQALLHSTKTTVWFGFMQRLLLSHSFSKFSFSISVLPLSFPMSAVSNL